MVLVLGKRGEKSNFSPLLRKFYPAQIGLDHPAAIAESKTTA